MTPANIKEFVLTFPIPFTDTTYYANLLAGYNTSADYYYGFKNGYKKTDSITLYCYYNGSRPVHWFAIGK